MAVLTRHKSTVYGLVTDLTNIQNAVGLTNSLTYQPVAGSSYISTATSVRNASDLLDAALHNVSDELASEVTRATTAEGVITSNLNAEIQRATTAEGTLTTNLSNEVQRATTAEGTLQDNLDAEILRATQAEEALTTASNTAINAEVLRATQAEGQLQLNLDAEVLRATTAEGTLTTNLNNEVQRATAAEGTLTTNLGAEVTRATTAEGVLQGNIEAEAVARGNTDEALETAINNEVNARSTADSDLSDAIGAEASTRLDADNAIISDLADEVQARESADLIHTQDIGARVKLAGDTMSGDLDFNAIYTVKGLREPTLPGDAATKNYVDSLAGGLSWQEPVDSVGDELPETADAGARFLNTTDSKIYTATDVDTWDAGVTPEDGYALFARSDETGYVFSGTAWVQFTGTGQIVAGVGLSKVGNVIDVNLGAGIAELPGDEVGIDLFTGGGLFLTVDGSTDDNTTAAQVAVKLDGNTITRTVDGIKVSDAQILRITTLETGLNTEISDRTSADNLLRDNIDAEVQNRTNADELLQDNIDAEVLRATTAEGTLTTNLGAEVTRATTAEGTLTTNLSNEVQRATTAEGTLQDNIDAEVLRATNAEGTLTTNLGNEVTRATTAEGVLQGNIDDEVQRATTAEGTLTTNLGAEVTRATTAEGTLQDNIDAEVLRATTAEGTLTTGLANLSGVTDVGAARTNLSVYSKAEVDAAIAGGGSVFVTEVLTVDADSITLGHAPKNGVIFNFSTVRHTDSNFVSYDIPVSVGASANVFNLSPNSSGEFDGKDVVVQYAYIPGV